MNTNILKKHIPTLAKHVYTHKHTYAFSTFGLFAIIKTALLFCGFFGLLSIINSKHVRANFDNPATICTEVTDISYDECTALIDLYNSTSGDEWTNNDNWGNTGQVCGVWTGVSCVCPSPFNNPDIYTCEGGHVRQIHLNGNNLVGTITESLQNFSWIFSFDVSNNTITSLPDVFSGTVMGDNLYRLMVATNEITDIPSSLYSSHVEYRDFTENNITYIDPSISGNSSLKHLFIGYNDELSIPDSVWEMTGMRGLGLQGFGLSSLPESFADFHDLQVLYLDNNEFTSVPEQILGLTGLWLLSLRGNTITSLSDGIFSGMNLSELNISSNALSSISEHAFSGLSNLIYLYLDDNVLETLPDGLFDDLSAAEGSLLWTLDLSFNQLTSLPESVYSIPWLQDLIVEGNEITTISESICDYNYLSRLNLRNNNITQLPSCFGTISSLTTLNLENNQLTSLPENFSSLTNLNKLTLNNNLLSGSIDFLLSFEELNTDYSNISYNYFSVDELDETRENFLDTYFLHSQGLYTRKDQYRIHNAYITGSLTSASGTIYPGDTFTYTISYGNSGEDMVVNGIVGLSFSTGGLFINSGDRTYSPRYGGIFGTSGDPCYDQLIENSTGAYADHLELFIHETNFNGFSSMYDFTRSFVDGAEGIGENEWGAYFVPAAEGYAGSFSAFMNIALLGEYARELETFEQCGSGGIPTYLLDIGDITPGSTGSVDINFMVDPATTETGITLSSIITSQNLVLSIDSDLTNNSSITSELAIIPLPEDEEEEEKCGNDIIDEGETCDGENFNGTLCSDLGYDAGTLSCSLSCILDTSACTFSPVELPEGLDNICIAYEHYTQNRRFDAAHIAEVMLGGGTFQVNHFPYAHYLLAMAQMQQHSGDTQALLNLNDILDRQGIIQVNNESDFRDAVAELEPMMLSGPVLHMNPLGGFTYNQGIANICAIRGCTDTVANNYNPDATQDDGSCAYTTHNPSGGGGGGGAILIQDLCDDLDCSDSYYDRNCGVCPTEETAHNAADDIFRIVGSPYSDEINSAYLRAYSFGITTKPTIKKANIEGPLTRTDLAKMLVNYADKVLGLPIITGNVCSFTDISNESTENQYYALMACKLGLMGLKSDGTPNRLFNPTGEVTRAEFGTALSRLLYGDTYNTIKESKWYVNHLAILKKNRIMKNIRTPYAKELRGWVMLMLMRIGQEK